MLVVGLAHGGLVKLAESGDLEPNGTNQFFIINQDPTINERGQVAFYTDLRNHDGFAQGFGFFLADGETNTTIAKTGQPAPDANGNFNTFHDPAALNTSNQVFLANLTGTLGGGSDDVGIYQMSGGVLTQMARKGQPAAPGTGTFQSLANASVPINRSGQTAFTGTSSNVIAVFRSTGTNVTRLAYYTEPSPDGNGTLGNLFVTPSINNNGQVAFLDTMLSSTNGSGFAFLLADGNSLKVMARSQQRSPDENGVFLLFPNGLPAINDHAQMAVVAILSGTTGGTADNEGLYRTDGNTTVQLARKGQAVPNGNGRFLDFGQGYPAINNNGQVAFFANLTGTAGGSSDNAGIFLVDGNSVKQLARKGQAAPDSNGVYSTFGLGRPVLNNKGQVAFRATLTGTSGGTTDNQGIFLVDADGSILQIIRSGWIIDGETVFTPNFLEGPNYGGMTGLNDEGQMAVWSALNGNHAVYLWSRPVMTGTTVANNVVNVRWTSFGGATNVVQAASSLTGTFTNVATIPARANRLVRTNFSEAIAPATPVRFYRIGETK